MRRSPHAGASLLALAQAPNSHAREPTGHQAAARSRSSSRSCAATSSRSTAASARPTSSSPRAATRPTCPTCSSASAELYVEKSRYVYYLQAETRPEGIKGAMVSPETKLLKQKAIQIYTARAARVPRLQGRRQGHLLPGARAARAGRVRHRCSRRWADLVKKYPSSPLRLDAEQILGDYYFDKADLKQAEEHYRAILDAPPRRCTTWPATRWGGFASTRPTTPRR